MYKVLITTSKYDAGVHALVVETVTEAEADKIFRRVNKQVERSYGQFALRLL
jgi:hypothetical protein